jgi:hypothetical protein
MEPSDLTVKILGEIRDEVRSVREEVHGLGQSLGRRIDETNDRVDQVIVRLDRVEHRQVETEVRLATEIVGVAAAIREVRDELEHRALRASVDDHERRIVAMANRAV